VLVCPECRHSNPEDSEVCANCGRSLEPGQIFLGAQRQPGGGGQLEIEPPRPPPRWIPWAILGALAAAGATFFLVRQALNPCREATFTSERFGYCLQPPEGWLAGAARIGSAQIDQFQPPTETATIFVEAIDLAEGTDLNAFSEIVRQRDEDAGLAPGPVIQREQPLDGQAALQWDVVVNPEDGATYQMREVVTVLGEIGWRITLSGSEDDFDQYVTSFDLMLDSWRYR
jgi:hypothetical protein